MTSKSRLLSSVVNKPETLVGASLNNPSEVNLQSLETAATEYTDVTTLPASGYIGEQAFVASTNRLYIWTGTGWFNIALVNTDPTISSAGAANYTMSYGTPITVDVDASDPEGLGLSYSYYTSDSIGSIATISQDSSQFTITPSSDYSVEGSFGLVFRASDGPNIASSSTSTFTLTNQSPSLSGNSASYVLATDGSTPTVITLTSVDPEGQPITYTATGDSGFNAIATVSNDSSVFTITPKSEDSATTGTGTLTFTASDGVKSTNGTSSFTLNFITIVTNSKHTSLLATATGTSDNNNITDASPNNHTITIGGDTYAGTFSPYRSGGYSTLFGLNTSYGRYELTNNISLTGDFTIEFWFSGTEYTGRNQILGSGFNIRKTGSGWYTSIAWPHGSYSIPNGEVPGSEWHWVQLIRSSGSAQLYVDGNAVGSAVANTTTYNLSGGYANKLIIGYEQASERLDGYLRDFRISNIARTEAIPTEPLELDSNTHVLLFNKAAQVAETGLGNTLTLTELNNPEIHPIGPYDYNEYSAADNGGSVHFDGSGDNLQTANTISLSGDFTVSAWVYLQGSSKGIIFGSNYPPNFQFFIESSNIIGFYDGSTENGTGEIQRDKWNYCVWTRSGSTVSMYINGESSGSANSTSTFQIKFVGSLGGIHDLVNGYISDAQVKTTSTSAANAVPPTAPLSSTGTELHIKGTDASIIDTAQSTNLKLFGNTTGSTTQVKFADTKSMYFDGTGDYILSQEPVKLGTQDFTAECWLYYESGLELMGNRTVSDSGGFSVRISSTTLTVGNSSGTGFGSVFSGTTSSLTNAWHHIAVSRSSGVTKIYVDGTSIASHSNSIDFSLSNPFVIGYAYTNGSGADPIQGYIQDFRVTTDLARYTANFTPPTASLKG